MTDPLCTQAWLLVGVTGDVPGILELINGRLVFTSNQGRVFDTPLTAVTDVKFPWHYFGGGVKFNIGADTHRLSFVRPNDGGDVSEELLSRTTLDGSPSTIRVLDVKTGRRAGKAWKVVLSQVLPKQAHRF